MATSLSKLVDNLTEDMHGDKCVDCKSDLSYMKVIDEALIFRFFNCKKNYEKEINKELIERFVSTYKFCNNDLNKSVMLLRKGVYPDEYMDGWDKFNETSIPNKESFYSNLTMENITETDYIHANNVFKTFKLNNLGDYHDLYVQSDTLLFADVFENFIKAFIKTYELDPAHFMKKTGVELELLTDYDMLLMIEEGIRGGIGAIQKVRTLSSGGGGGTQKAYRSIQGEGEVMQECTYANNLANTRSFYFVLLCHFPLTF